MSSDTIVKVAEGMQVVVNVLNKVVEDNGPDVGDWPDTALIKSIDVVFDFVQKAVME